MKSGRIIQRVLLGIAVCALIAVVVVFIGYRKITTQPQPVMDLVKKAAEMHLDKVRQTASKNGIREWQMEALSATLLDGKEIMELEQPDVDFYMADGDEIHLTAKRGRIYTDSNRMTVSGDVAASTRLYRFFSDSL